MPPWMPRQAGVSQGSPAKQKEQHPSFDSCWLDSPVHSSSQEDDGYDFDDIHQSYMDDDDEEEDSFSDDKYKPQIGIAVEYPVNEANSLHSLSHRLSPIRESRFEPEGDMILPSLSRLQFPKTVQQPEILHNSAQIEDAEHGALKHWFDNAPASSQTSSPVSPGKGSDYWSDTAFASPSSRNSPFWTNDEVSIDSAKRSAILSPAVLQATDGRETPDKSTNNRVEAHKGAHFTEKPSLQSLSLADIRSQLRISEEVTVETTQCKSSVLDGPSDMSRAWAEERFPSRICSPCADPVKALPSRSYPGDMMSVAASRLEARACPGVQLGPSEASPIGSALKTDTESPTIGGRYTSSNRVLAARQHLESLEARLKRYRTPEASDGSLTNQQASTVCTKAVRLPRVQKSPLHESSHWEEHDQDMSRSYRRDDKQDDLHQKNCAAVIRSERLLESTWSDVSASSSLVASRSEITPQESPKRHPKSPADQRSGRTLDDYVNDADRLTERPIAFHEKQSFHHNLKLIQPVKSSQGEDDLHRPDDPTRQMPSSTARFDLDPKKMHERQKRSNGTDAPKASDSTALHPTKSEATKIATLRPPPPSTRLLRKSSSDPELSRKFVMSYGQDLDLPQCKLPRMKAKVEIIKQGNPLDTVQTVKSVDQEISQTSDDHNSSDAKASSDSELYSQTPKGRKLMGTALQASQ